ncbi:MAG: SH3 domain-containing protein [Anaerolineae bacterium]|nr:SH3 domain-containing protein [Anaerolineae bacterium]
MLNAALWALLLLPGVPALAQAIECPALEQAALAESGLWCTDIAPGELCYGNARVETTFRSAQPPLTGPGSRAPLADMSQVVTLTGANVWGVALARVEAYPVDSWSAAPATLILLGDTRVVDASTERTAASVITLPVTEVANANVRARPNTAAAIVGAAFGGELIKLTGRLADTSWVRVQTPAGVTGWLSALTFDAQVSGLPVVDSADPAPALFTRPFAAFDFVSAGGPARCAGVPESGLLLQTPADRAYRFRINGADVALAGTLFAQAAPEATLRLAVLEGRAVIGLRDGVTVEQGLETRLPTGRQADGLPVVNGAPAAPVPYDHVALLPLPLRLLPRLTYVVFDLGTIIRPRPASGASPLAGVLVSDPCVIAVGADGVNVRSGPGLEFPVRRLLNFRESALVIGRATGTDAANWWQLAQDVWIAGAVTVTGGNCAAVPVVPVPLLPPPPAAAP